MPSFPCITCKKSVTARDHALQCDTCNEWNHRRCGTGISRALYKKLVNGQEEIDWWCSRCGVPDGINPDHDPTFFGDSTPSLREEVSIEQPMEQQTEAIPVPVPEPMEEQNDDNSIDDQLEPAPFPGGEPLEDSTGNDNSMDDQLEPAPCPGEPLEDSVDDRTIIDDDMTVDDQPTFQVLDNASQRGGKVLADSRGYTFTARSTRKDTVYWWCSVRNKTTRCPATVVQKGADTFKEGSKSHSHPAKPGIHKAVAITAQIKETAKQQIRDSARSVVENIMQTETNVEEPEYSRPKQSNLIRIANRAREALRPKDPQNLNFQINGAFIPPDFLQADVEVDDERHIILATQEQLKLLSDAKVWYLDGTFKVVRRHFYQLLPIHSFLRSGQEVKQVPLAYVLMSRRRRIDYKAVIRRLLATLPHRPAVRKIVVDFEIAMWKAVQQCLPRVEVKGCAFHWTQAVFRKAQELALQGPYRQKAIIHKIVRQLLALVYLPAEEIQRVFERLREKATTSALQELFEYVDRQWIKNNFWKPDLWSVYGLSTRTNNDCEGWHRRLNDKAGELQLGFYKLVPLLHTEAQLIPLQKVLLSEGKLQRLQKKVLSSDCLYFRCHSRLV